MQKNFFTDFKLDMIINSFSYPNKKYTPYTKQVNYTSAPKDIYFKGSYAFLKPDIVDSLNYIGKAYQEISEHLSLKNDKGLEIIQKNCDFELGRSMIFHNCGKDKNTILVSVPDSKTPRELMKIVVKKGKDYPDNKIFLNSFTISEYNKILKDENPNKAYIFPNNAEFLKSEELKNTNIESNLQNVLEDLDIEMLKLRKYLIKLGEQFSKPKVFKLEDKTLENFKNIDSLYEKTDKLLKTLPEKFSIKLRNEYGDYKLQAKQPTHILTNIGDEKNQIVFKKLNNPTHGTLTRIMVLDQNDEIVKGYLFDKENRLISNFNPKNFNIIPPKLTFHDKGSAEAIMPELEKYLQKYSEKLEDFNKFLNQKIYERSLAPVIGKIKGEPLEQVKGLYEIYDDLTEKFSQLNNTALSKIKTSYPKWNAIGGQRGFVFKTGNGENISIVKMNGKNGNKFIRLCIADKGESKYLLFSQDQVVKNFNPKYPQLLPPVVKYYNDIEIDEIGIEPFIKKAFSEIEEFKNYFDSPNPIPQNISDNYSEISKCGKSANNIKKSDSEEYKKLMKECKTRFAEAMQNAENNLQDFNKILADIQKKINNFFEK